MVEVFTFKYITTSHEKSCNIGDEASAVVGVTSFDVPSRRIPKSRFTGETKAFVEEMKLGGRALALNN